MSDNDALTIGPDPGSLTVRFVTGDAWAASLVLIDADTGDAIAWPTAPMLELELSPTVNVTATLGKDQPSDANNSMATWQRTEEEVDDIRDGAKVRLSVEGSTWWMGWTQCRS